jgi:hypothetical protein
MIIKKFITRNNWIARLLWIVIGSVITLFCGKAFNKIMPESAVIVKEVPDTIKVIHSYDFNNSFDSIVNSQLKRKLENVRLSDLYEPETKKTIRRNKEKLNAVMIDYKFPNAKGYSVNQASSYFFMNFPSLEGKFLDFNIKFLNYELIKDIYCISIKIDAINNGKLSVYLDEYYNVNSNCNIIRIANSLPKGLYEISAGFFLKKDINSEYPCYYRTNKILRKQ